MIQTYLPYHNRADIFKPSATSSSTFPSTFNFNMSNSKCLTIMPPVRGYYFDDTREMIYAKNALEAISRRFHKHIYTSSTIKSIDFKPLNSENIEAVVWLTCVDYPVSVISLDGCMEGGSMPPPGKCVLVKKVDRMSSYYMNYLIEQIGKHDSSCANCLWGEFVSLKDCTSVQIRQLERAIITLCSESDARVGLQALSDITKQANASL